MAEFGENLKRIREEKGITQQTLADNLYVTRQAISRWEGGSRYPDLMTAKKMSRYLEVSMDELVSDDDMQQTVEKSVILESPVANRVQMVMMALAFMCFLSMCIIHLAHYVTQYLTQGAYYYDSNGLMFRTVSLLLVLGYGVYNAVRDKMNPRMASIITVLYFGVVVVFNITEFFTDSYLSVPQLLGYTLLDMVPLILIPMFFSGKRLRNPVPVYVVLGVFVLLNIPSWFSMFTEDHPAEIRVLLFIINTLSLVAHTVTLGMLASMVYALHRKRQLATR